MMIFLKSVAEYMTGEIPGEGKKENKHSNRREDKLN